MLTPLLDLLFPKRSLRGEEGAWITEDEMLSLCPLPVRLDKNLLRKREIRHLDCLVAAGSYDASPLLRKAILSFKYGGVRALHRPLSGLLVKALPGLLLRPKDTKTEELMTPTLCPVPLHWTRRFQRGFNQAE